MYFLVVRAAFVPYNLAIMTHQLPTMAENGKRGRKLKWPRIRSRYTRTKAEGIKCYVVDAGTFGLTEEQLAKGVTRNRRTFSTLADAEKHAQVLRTKRSADQKAEKFSAENRAVSLANLNDAQRSDVLTAFRALDGTRGTLAGCVDFWKKHAAPANARTCRQSLDELVAACESANRRPRTVAELEAKVGEFCADYGTEPIARVTAADVSAWLDQRTKKLSPRSRAAYRQALNRLFAFAVKREYREGNPVHAIEKPSVETPAPEVFTVAEARALLTKAQATDPRMVPYYAVGLFAGLRTENELAGLDWRMIDLAGHTIEVTAASAKKRRARTVEISDNLALWLAPHRKDAGPIFFSRRAHRKIISKADNDKALRWPRNVMRHSFASYHLAAHKDAGRTALQLGHPHGVEILFNHYRRMVKESTAKDYWQICPSVAGNVIHLNAATA